MAEKKSKKSESTKIRRIKATDDQPKKTVKKTTKKTNSIVAKAEKVVAKKSSNKNKNPFVALLDYFRGSWAELKLVRWPTRSATWSMTFAVIIFTVIFVLLILLLDAGFNVLFEKILS